MSRFAGARPRARLIARRLPRRAGVVGRYVMAAAGGADPLVLAVNSLPQVVANLQDFLMGMLFAVATLFGAWAALLWATAGGDSGQLERAKLALRNALVGCGLAVLSPVLVQVVKGIVGG